MHYKKAKVAFSNIIFRHLRERKKEKRFNTKNSVVNYLINKKFENLINVL